MARPSKYSAEVAEQVASGIRIGLTTKDAALVAGITDDTLKNWEKRYSGFSDLIARARAQRAATFLAKAREKGQDDWRFWLEMLDRCEPEYRKRAAIELSGPDGGAIEIRGVELPLPVRIEPEDGDGAAEGSHSAPLLIPLPAKANGTRGGPDG